MGQEYGVVVPVVRIVALVGQLLNTGAIPSNITTFEIQVKESPVRVFKINLASKVFPASAQV